MQIIFHYYRMKLMILLLCFQLAVINTEYTKGKLINDIDKIKKEFEIETDYAKLIIYEKYYMIFEKIFNDLKEEPPITKLIWKTMLKSMEEVITQLKNKRDKFFIENACKNNTHL